MYACTHMCMYAYVHAFIAYINNNDNNRYRLLFDLNVYSIIIMLLNIL